MCGELNGLQALFLHERLYAYYVHCFAHCLQLTLVVTSREVIHLYNFFSKLALGINIVCASSKHNEELHIAQAVEVEQKIVNDEFESRRGLNQIALCNGLEIQVEDCILIMFAT